MEERGEIRPWAVVLEVVGWLGLALTTFVGGWIVVVTIQVCRELAPLEGQHAGCGIDVAVGAVALAVVAVFWLGAGLFVIAGRWWRRPRAARARRGADVAPPPPPSWWYDPRS